MHYFLAETHVFKMEGKFSMYFDVFLGDLNLWRFRSGLVAKIVFMRFPCGFTVLGNVCIVRILQLLFVFVRISRVGRVLSKLR